MSLGGNKQIQLHDFKPGLEQFYADVLDGLRKQQKELPCKYFYDDKGSRLYEQICNLDEYYIPYTEVTIMETNIEEMAKLLGPEALLIEYGSGSSTKTRILLDHLYRLTAYIPVDISHEQLLRVTERLTLDYPGLDVFPVCADFTGNFELPTVNHTFKRRVVYFPGSTIGNLDPVRVKGILENIAAICGQDGGILVGVDLKKDQAVLHSAYNDDQGVTAAFNLNMLERINRELDCDFRLECFEHRAFYNPKEGRVEMHLVSLKDQAVHLNGVTITFTHGESIWTESSYKYNIDEFEQIAVAAGLKVEHVWTDERRWFSVQYLVNDSTAVPSS
ncbi:MAG: L-histidine N(alpha)-methyltransferase [Dehalococcoidales bacterium]|nr:MAG: L-histidine N(alpha)-methyltransferase [Dehalococcoidales bacterium]